MSLDKSWGVADQLLSRLLNGEIGGGDLENQLLREFQEGYPLQKLRLMLGAKNDKVVAAGAWIASELGTSARPLFTDIVGLIHHPCAHVRFFVLGCLLLCAQPADGAAIDQALKLIDDPEPSVRWKALVFIATASDPVIRGALNMSTTNDPTSVRRKGLSLLLESTASGDIAAISLGLADSDAVLRRYAAAAAVKVVHRDPKPLMQAMQSSDPTIKKFADDMAARAGIAAI